MSDGKILLLALSFPFVISLLIFLVIGLMENLYFEGAKDHATEKVVCYEIPNEIICRKVIHE